MRKPVIWRAVMVWFAVLALANLNGGVREMWLIPRLGADAGRVISTVLLCGLVLGVTWLMIGWIRPETETEALCVGGFWLILTLAFEFLIGHYVFRKPWSVLLEDYDVSRGGIWVAVLVVVLLAPSWTARVRGFLGDQP